jgi:hypothetical protein
MRRQRDLAAVLAAVMSLGAAGAAPASAQTTATNIGGRLELFVDRYLIQTLDNASLKMHRPVDKGIVFQNDMPWEGNRCSRHSLVKDGDRFRCYYEAGHITNTAVSSPEYPFVTCFRTSSNGVTWEVPSFGLTSFKGSAENNMLPEDPQGLVQRLVPPIAYLNDNPNAPAQDKFLGLVHDFNTTRIQFFISSSPDGLLWTRKTSPFYEVAKGDDGHVVFWDSNLGQYVAYLRIYYNPTTGLTGGYDLSGGIRWVQRLLSTNLTTWSSPVLLRFKDASGGDAVAEHIYQFCAEQYFRAPHLYVVIAPRDILGRSLPELADWDLGGRPKQLTEGMFMTSRDGLNWDRTFMEAVFRPGLDFGNWAWKTMWPVRGFIQTGTNELSGYTYERACWGTRVMGNPRVRRWVWRLDGFASVNAGSAGGEMITKPFVFSGSRLVLNYATAAAGSIRVEIQNTNGVPVTGFALADFPEKQGDDIQGVMSWNGQSDVGALTGTPVRLRFVLKDADLYSMQFTN